MKTGTKVQRWQCTAAGSEIKRCQGLEDEFNHGINFLSELNETKDILVQTCERKLSLYLRVKAFVFSGCEAERVNPCSDSKPKSLMSISRKPPLQTSAPERNNEFGKQLQTPSQQNPKGSPPYDHRGIRRCDVEHVSNGSSGPVAGLMNLMNLENIKISISRITRKPDYRSNQLSISTFHGKWFHNENNYLGLATISNSAKEHLYKLCHNITVPRYKAE